MSAALHTLMSGGALASGEAEHMFAAMLSGELDEIGTAAALVALRVRGETPAELTGAARALLAAAVPFPRPAGPLADCCGTGGDGSGTLNVSTAVAFAVAACGLPVAKHGNRAVSSRSGSADVLAVLGARLDLDPAANRRVLDASGVAFLFAPRLHPGIARVMPVRRALGTRTIFNLLGPLVNPARPDLQLMGVYDPGLCQAVAETLGELGVARALVVHGGGLDELALHADSLAVRMVAGRTERLRLTPADFGLRSAPRRALAGGTPETNARALRAVLAGRGSRAYRDAVTMNAAALLWLAGMASGPQAAATRVATVLASGQPAAVLDAFLGAQTHA